MADLRETILAAPDLKSEIITVDEWGCAIEVRELSGLGRQRFFSLVAPPEGGQIDLLRFHAAAVVLGAHEPSGGPIFRQGEGDIEQEIAEICGKSASAIFAVGERVLDLSGIGERSSARIEKNSGTDAGSE
jgi:hypothetical protein